ncbi:MAG: hypothetical protein RL030_2208, partial [Pseudomonadota bacterium]
SRQVAAIDRVVALAPDSRFAGIARSYDALVKSDFAAADRLLSASLDAPSSLGLQTQLRYGQFLGVVGRLAESLEVLKGVHAADPLNNFSHMQLVSAYTSVGEFQQADAELDAILRQPGGDTPLARGQTLALAMQRGDRAAVVAELDVDRSPTDPVGLVLVQHRDNLEAAMPQLAAMLEDDQFNENPYALTRIASWAGFLGFPDVALAALKRLPALGLSVETWARFLWGATLAEARQTPAFKDFVRELGLVDYWRSTGNWGDYCKPVGTDDFECR